MRLFSKPPNEPPRTWFQRFGLFFYDRREMTFLFWVALIIFGLLCYTVQLRRQGFPNVDVPLSTVTGTYFVNDAAKVDADVTKPASEVILKLDEVEGVISSAAGNFFTIFIQYEEGTASAEANAKVRQTLQSNNVLPQAARAEYRPIDAARFEEQSDLLVSVYSAERLDQRSLEQRAGAVARQLEDREGIERTKVFNQFETGTNPLTGQQSVEQRRFDRTGVREGNRIAFYPSVTIGVAGKTDGDAIQLYEDVQTALGDISRQPEGKDLRLIVAADFAEGIKAQVDSLQENLLAGLIVVLIISFMLISWRVGLVVAISMITVLLITVAILYATGNTLNTITLFALVLCLGLIVDDTIIMVEAIDAAKRSSREKREIIALAMKRVARASTTGTITTMLGFAPMLFVSGILGSFIRVLPITIIISLAVSLLVSLTLVPFLSRYLILTEAARRATSRNPVPRVEKAISNFLAATVRIGKRSRAKGLLIGTAALVFSLVLFVSSFSYFQKLKFDIFPATKDTDALIANMRFAPGTDIQTAQTRADAANRIIGQTIGDNARRIAYQSSGTTTEAIAVVDLVSYQDREPTSPQLVTKLQDAFKDFEGASIKVSQVDVGPPREDFPFKVQVYNEDRARATRLASTIQSFLQNRDIERTNGTTARITRTEISDPGSVTRQDGKQMVEVGAGFDADDLSALVTATENTVKEEFDKDRLASLGYAEDALKFDFGSESDNQDSFRTMVIAFPILLAVMYVLMALQFRSFLQPLLIFMAIPFSFFGVAAGLYFTDNPLSFFVSIGFFALIGIAVNNTILLTDYANQAREQGLDRLDAMAEAIRARFRPLLTTSLTSVVALVPLALSDPFWESLSFTLIFGLLSSTLSVIITFPYIYLAGEGLRILGHKIWQRQLWPPLQFVLDFIILPIRLIDHVLHIGFRYNNNHEKSSQGLGTPRR